MYNKTSEQKRFVLFEYSDKRWGCIIEWTLQLLKIQIKSVQVHCHYQL